MSRKPSPESLEALKSGDKTRSRELVFQHIDRCGSAGSTIDEACEALRTEAHRISGRFRELERLELIRRLVDQSGKRVQRSTRLGCAAGVWVSSRFAPAAKNSTQTSLFGPQNREHLDLG